MPEIEPNAAPPLRLVPAAADKSPNSAELSLNPSKSREEGEVSSDDNDENHFHSAARSPSTSVLPPGPVPVPSVNKLTQVGKVVSPANSADIQFQISKQPVSQKSNDVNRLPLKPAAPGWRPPRARSGPNNNLVISFSDDDSQSDSEEKEDGKLKIAHTKSNITRVNANGKPPISSIAKPNKLGQPARNVNKVMPKKLSMNRTFITSMANIRGVNSRDSVSSSVEQGSRVGNFNAMNKNIVNRERGYELQDLRQQIALKETELKLKESELKLKSAQRTKESVACKDEIAKGLQRDGAGKCSTGYSDGLQIEPKEPDKKRIKVSGTFSTQLTALSPQELPIEKPLLPSKITAMEVNTKMDASKIEHLRKESQMCPTESSIVKWQNPSDKHCTGMLGNIHTGQKDGSGIDAKYIQAEGRGKQKESSVTANKDKSLAKAVCIDFPNNSNSAELNHTTTNTISGHLEPGSFLKYATSGKNGDPWDTLSIDKRPEPSFYSTCQALLNNTNFSNCLGNANVTGDDSMKMQSLIQMEEMLDKNLEEAQEYRRRCEIEEQNALKAYRKAQRALLEANARCDVLYRKRELYSADFRAYVIDNPSLLCSSRQNEQTGLGLDHTNNLSDNLGLVLPSSHQMPEEHNDCNLAVIGSSIQGVNSAQIPSSYQHLGGENNGSEPCSEPDASTSEPAALLGNNGRDGVCSPSEPNGSLNEDDDTFSFENESVQPISECHIVNKQKETDDGSNRVMSIDTNEESLLLEKALRSTLFAKLGTKHVSKNGVVSNVTGISVEQEAENDARSEEPPQVNSRSPLSEMETNQPSDIEGTEGQRRSFSESPLEIQKEHTIKNLFLNSHFSEYSEDRCSFGGDHSLATMIFSPSYILSSAFGYMMEYQDGSEQSGICSTNIEEDACMNSGKAQFVSTVIDATKKTLVKLCDREDGSYATGPAVDTFWPLCMYELRGKCNNDECPWQHAKDYSTSNMFPHQHDNSEIADCQVGHALCKEKCDGSAKFPWRHNVMTVPTYLVGLSTLKADQHSYDSVLARRSGECWKKCFSLFLALSKSFQKGFLADGPVLHGNDGRIEVPVSRNRQSSYFQSRNIGVNQLDQASAGNEQFLEKALLVFSQEVNALEGMRKALPVLSRGLEADPTSVILWVFYLLIYYSNMKSVGKDDMFSCAVNYNDQSYELWIMFINSRSQLSDRLVTYDLALSALCCHASSSKDKMHASACILDLVLQMVDCLCMSGNVERAIQKICGLFSAAANIYDPDSPLLTDIPTCLTSRDKCILGICCVYLVIYKKLPDAVVLQFECQKELSAIEWPSIELADDEKQKAFKLMEVVEDSVCQSLDKIELNLSLAHFFALNHLRCVAAIDSLERCSSLLSRYLKMFPSCLELVLISARAHKHTPDDSLFNGFEEALNNWPKEVPGIQCIWNQYAVYALQKGQFDFGKELIGRWFHSLHQDLCLRNHALDDMECDNSDGSLALDSVLQTLDTDFQQMDIMFGYLNLSLYKLTQNDRTGACVAIEKALKASVPEYSKHCMREHALFMLSEKSGFKENCCHSVMEKILKCYVGDAQAFPLCEPLSRQFIASVKKPRVRQLVSDVFSPFSSDFSLVNSVLEVWFGPSLLPKKTGETKYLVDFVEAIFNLTPSNYQFAISVCKLLNNGSHETDITLASVLFWASSNLVDAIFHAVPIPPEFVWIEAAQILGNMVNVEVISERFYKRALSVYPFSVKLWKSYYMLSVMTTGNVNTVVETAKEKGTTEACT
ncbi:uncharacterized protein LOC126801759 [Argentina anserina]|uniref:uncharacterized protein LOC126801759 n=1 Tax=Argentina anserina TaxID=57926 RepID=UPI0021766F7B|nr:uncharacterized protein LOC126801759 [Potentilla anserina]